jgi:hypothetical protein
MGDYSHYSIFIIIATAILILYNVFKWKEIQATIELGRDLFFSKFNVYPNNIEYEHKSLSQHDYLTLGIFGPATHLKFFLKGKEFRGIISKEEQKLFMEEPVYMPVFSAKAIPVWKDVKKRYGTGIPKKIEYYDDMRTLVGIDFFNEIGILIDKSWRMYKGRRETWSMKNHEWIPQKNV